MTAISGIDWTPIVIAGSAAAAVLLAGGLLTEIGTWYNALVKPSWQPPGWAFGPAWTLIAAFTATAAVLTWRELPEDSGTRTTLLVLYAINGLLNVGWSLLFFKMRRPDWALVETVGLWLSIAALIAFTRPLQPTASWLLVPYIAWVSFASVLNWTIVRLNWPFAGVRL